MNGVCNQYKLPSLICSFFAFASLPLRKGKQILRQNKRTIMVQHKIIMLWVLLLLASSAQATISRATPEEVQRLRWREGPANQARPSWAPVRPLLGNRNFTPLLQNLLESKDSWDRARAAFLLGLIYERDSADRIAGLLRAEERSVRVFSGLALGFLGDERGIHVCDAVLKADPPWVRYYAVYGLWCMNSQRAGAVLRRNSSTGITWVDEVIDDARKTRFMVASPEWSQALREGYKPTADDLWAVVCDVLIVEADQWWHKGSYEQTIRCQEAALFLDPTHTDGYSLVAWLQWSQGDDAAAIRTLERGTKAVPESPDTWGALGQHYWLTKRYALAEAPLRKSVELGGDHLYRRSYAHSLEKLGKTEECVRQWEAIVEECPEDGAAKNNLERLRKLVAEQG